MQYPNRRSNSTDSLMSTCCFTAAERTSHGVVSTPIVFCRCTSVAAFATTPGAGRASPSNTVGIAFPEIAAVAAFGCGSCSYCTTLCCCCCDGSPLPLHRVGPCCCTHGGLVMLLQHLVVLKQSNSRKMHGLLVPRRLNHARSAVGVSTAAAARQQHKALSPSMACLFCTTYRDKDQNKRTMGVRTPHRPPVLLVQHCLHIGMALWRPP